MSSRQEYWGQLESALFLLVDSVSSQIDPKSLDSVRHYIGNREFGLALELLVFLVPERSIIVSTQQRDEIQRLAQLMQIDLDQ